MYVIYMCAYLSFSILEPPLCDNAPAVTIDSVPTLFPVLNVVLGVDSSTCPAFTLSKQCICPSFFQGMKTGCMRLSWPPARLSAGWLASWAAAARAPEKEKGRENEKEGVPKGKRRRKRKKAMPVADGGSGRNTEVSSLAGVFRRVSDWACSCLLGALAAPAGQAASEPRNKPCGSVYYNCEPGIVSAFLLLQANRN